MTTGVGATRPTLSRRAAAVAAVGWLGLLAGCGGREPEVAPPAAAEVADSLRFETDAIDLGPLEPGASARAVFTFTNPSAEPLRLILGGPSCTCLQPELLCPPELPGGGVGKVALTLNTKDREGGGPVEGSVTLFTGRERGMYRLTVTGYLDGYVGTVPPNPYAIRGYHIRTGQIPPLRFQICTHRADARVAVTSVTVCRPEAARTKTAGPADVLANPVAELDKMTVGKPVHDPAFRYVHEFQVPVKINMTDAPTSGVFLVGYTIADNRHVVAIPLLVIPGDDDPSPPAPPRQMAGAAESGR